MTTSDPKAILRRLAAYHADHAEQSGGEYLGTVDVPCTCSCRCTYPLRRPGEIRAGVCSECAAGKCRKDGL